MTVKDSGCETPRYRICRIGRENHNNTYEREGGIVHPQEDRERKIYSIGSSNRDSKEFFGILQEYDIRLVVDIRRHPTSQLEHFRKHALRKLCHMRGVGYQWLGDRLGGMREEGYEAYMKTMDFRLGLTQLEALAEMQSTVFCCAEKLPSKCHRIFVAKRLVEKGWDVIHILEEDSTWDPDQMDLL